jgi:hypothetical protein
MRRRSKLARPNICRLIILILLAVPSTRPEFPASVGATPRPDLDTARSDRPWPRQATRPNPPCAGKRSHRKV